MSRIMQLFDTLNIDVVLIRIEIWNDRDRIVFPTDNDILTVQGNFARYLIISDRFDIANLLRFRTMMFLYSSTESPESIIIISY